MAIPLAYPLGVLAAYAIRQAAKRAIPALTRYLVGVMTGDQIYENMGEITKARVKEDADAIAKEQAKSECEQCKPSLGTLALKAVTGSKNPINIAYQFFICKLPIVLPCSIYEWFFYCYFDGLDHGRCTLLEAKGEYKFFNKKGDPYFSDDALGLGQAIRQNDVVKLYGGNKARLEWHFLTYEHWIYMTEVFRENRLNIITFNTPMPVAEAHRIIDPDLEVPVDKMKKFRKLESSAIL